MKLFGWMHTKFRQDSSEGVLGDLAAGSASNCLSRCLTMDDCHQFRALAPARISQPAINFPTMSEKDFMLESLLAIGTLGLSSSEPIMEESTRMAELEESEVVDVEAIAEKEETEVATETDLMVINAELEKVLLAEAEKEGDRLSSARPSHAGKASTECPLQEYLFGAKVEACTAEKKEKRASLGELFMIEEGEEGAKANGLINGSGATKELRRESTGVHVIMKRMLSRRKSTPRSPSTSYGDGNTTDKFNKVLQIFHRKVHPENNPASKKATKTISKQRNKGNPAMSYIGHCFIAGSSEQEPEIKTENTIRSEHVASIKPGQEDPPSLSLTKCDSMGSREYWIKTDIDYLVLEL